MLRVATILFIAPLALVGCKPNTPTAPQSSTVAPTGAPPRLALASTVLDLGEVPQTEMSSGQLVFRNEGGTPLVIEKIDASCGCTAVTLDQRRYEAGASGVRCPSNLPTGPTP